MIERLLGEFPSRAFLDQHYTRLPYSRAGGARGFTGFTGWPALERILGDPGADAFLAREGEMGEGGRAPTFEEARRRLGEGWTLVVRHAERHDPELRRLAEGFEADFRAPVNVHVYATPAGRTGFGWHYDPEDVFIVQTQGSKEYRLRKNTVNPWPVLETMPKNLRFEREVTPVWSCTLAAGDWLYIPTGWWHSARGVEESITLAIGLMTPSALDLLDFLRKELTSSVIWRRRLPPAGAANPRSAEELAEQYRALFSDLGKDLARFLTDEVAARKFLKYDNLYDNLASL
jgi:ribosomal protein L16 Arg81 hydroxylase